MEALVVHKAAVASYVVLVNQKHIVQVEEVVLRVVQAECLLVFRFHFAEELRDKLAFVN